MNIKDLEEYARGEPQELMDHVTACINALSRTDSKAAHAHTERLLLFQDKLRMETKSVIKEEENRENVRPNPRSSFYSAQNVFSSVGRKRMEIEATTNADVQNVIMGLDTVMDNAKHFITSLNSSNTHKQSLLENARKALLGMKATLTTVKEIVIGTGEDMVLEEFMEDVRELRDAAAFYMHQSMNLVDDRHVLKQRLLIMLEAYQSIKSELCGLYEYEFYDQQLISSMKRLFANLYQLHANSKHRSILMLQECFQRLNALARFSEFEVTSELVLTNLADKVEHIITLTRERLKSKDAQIENWRDECANLEMSFQTRVCNLQEALDKERSEANALRSNMEVMERTNRENIARLLSENQALQNQLDEVRKQVVILQARPIVEDVKRARITTTITQSVMSEGSEKRKGGECLIGFAGLSPRERDKLVKVAEPLGLNFYLGSDFTPRMTHLVCPEGYVSARVLAAAVSCKWLMSPDWLHACVQKGERACEVEHGGRKHKVSPLQGQFLSLTPQFEAALSDPKIQKDKGFQPPVDKKVFTNLVINLGKARLTPIGEGISLILEHTNPNHNSSSGSDNSGNASEGMTWKDLIKLVMNF